MQEVGDGALLAEGVAPDLGKAGQVVRVCVCVSPSTSSDVCSSRGKLFVGMLVTLNSLFLLPMCGK